jgi:hypothetical protein
MVGENHEFSSAVTRSIKKDLNQENETFVCLALHAVANIGGRELYASLVQDIYRLYLEQYGFHLNVDRALVLSGKKQDFAF